MISMPIMQHVSRVPSITSPNLTELNRSRSFSRIEFDLGGVATDAGADGGASVSFTTSVSVVAIKHFSGEESLWCRKFANYHGDSNNSKKSVPNFGSSKYQIL